MAAITITEKTINKLKPEIIKISKKVLTKINTKGKAYKVIWEIYEAEVQKELKKILDKTLKNSKVTLAHHKNEYPDVRIENKEGVFGIDIKAHIGESGPAYDMGRMENYEAGRHKKFVEEWELIIRFSKTKKTLEEVYFLPFHHIVGKRQDGGVTYRKYDGQLRPKSWKHIESETIHWKSRDILISAIRKTLKLLRNTQLQEFVNKLNSKEKDALRKILKSK